jgi:cytochrome c2
VKKELMVSGLIAMAAAACGPQQRDTDLRVTDMSTVTVTLSQGDVEAGRQAFLDLRCTACHAVPPEPEFPAPVSANPGPPI